MNTILGRLIGLLAIALVLPVTAEEIRGPKIEVSDPVYDFGKVAQGVVVHHEFSFRNRGSDDLVISGVSPSCGCTASYASSNTVKPGEEGKIVADVETDGFSGAKTKTVRVYTNDVKSPYVTLTLRGVIEPRVIIEPSHLIFDQVIKGQEEPLLQSFRVKTRGAKSPGDFKEVKVESLSRYLAVEKVSDNGDEGEYRVQLYSQTVPVGELRERLQLTIGKSTFNIPVFAYVKGALKVSPSSTVSFGVLSGDSPVSRTVVVENLSTTPLGFLKATTDSSLVSLNVEEVMPGKRYEITATVNPKEVSRNLRAKLTITTDSTVTKEQVIKLQGVVPPHI